MSYTYSICHPDQKDIEYVSEVLSKDEVLRVANEYPWNQQLNLMETMAEEEICYNPSLDFTCKEDKYSFCLTATRNDQKELEFSLWFNRKVTYKPLFGLLGKKEKMQVIDKRRFQKTDAIDYLKIFVDKDYQELEALMSI
jgi:hypothetical protein